METLRLLSFTFGCQGFVLYIQAQEELCPQFLDRKLLNYRHPGLNFSPLEIFKETVFVLDLRRKFDF